MEQSAFMAMLHLSLTLLIYLTGQHLAVWHHENLANQLLENSSSPKTKGQPPGQLLELHLAVSSHAFYTL